MKIPYSVLTVLLTVMLLVTTGTCLAEMCGFAVYIVLAAVSSFVKHS